jgi:hypothetical protein
LQAAWGRSFRMKAALSRGTQGSRKNKITF